MVDKLTSNSNKTEKQLVEIGPRFVLEPVRIISGSFEGKVLFNNDNFVSKRTKLSLKRKEIETKLSENSTLRKKRKKLLLKGKPDPIDNVFNENANE
jgi:ribosome biogenesis protein BRX1